GDIHKLSVRSCFPPFFRWEKERGSLLKGFLFSKKQKGKGLFTLKRGMELLIHALKEKLDAHLILNAEVSEIRENGVIAADTFYPADQIISALPGSVIGKLTGLWGDFEDLDLHEIHLAYQGNVLPKKGFGYLVPTLEKENLLGMIWESSVFPEQNHTEETRVTALMRKGSVDEAIDVMSRHLGVTEKPIFSSQFFAKSAIPQFHVGYFERLSRFKKEIKEKYPNLFILGNYVKGASVDSCISVSKEMFK
ncbi:MAG: hypothetical protein FJZ64_03850, partial [Chlamydiae bacterium]|nr:hypothetical protein [Chlamydiota bacterium]